MILKHASLPEGISLKAMLNMAAAACGRVELNRLFYTGLLGLVLFEVMNFYFIMPLPGSQDMPSIDLAYFLHSSRWLFRILFGAMATAGSIYAFQGMRKRVPVAALIFTLAVVYLFNFKIRPDKLFLQSEKSILTTQAENKVPGSRLVIGVVNNGEAKAYPIEFLTYHHQVLDTIGGKPVMVTYCNACRTGRVFEPIVNGRYEKFRLVGMNHFNAVFEDATTGSWWRQATGEAIAGKLKGQSLPEIESRQMTLEKWFELQPLAQVMQPDDAFTEVYDPLARFEQGREKGYLIGTDSLSWKEKSWVVGLRVGASRKAYDWNHLKQARIINDTIGQTSIVLALSSDGHSFTAFERPSNTLFTINHHDQLLSDYAAYNFSGENLSSPLCKLKNVQAYQEFWHSWNAFNPNTQRVLVEKSPLTKARIKTG